MTTQSQGSKLAMFLSRWTPSTFWIVATVLLAASILLPYWHMTLLAPQYPDGLSVRVFVNRMTGDRDPTLDEVSEIDGLNHYIGMRAMSEAASFERSLALPAVAVFAALLVIAAIWRGKWAWLLSIPALVFPLVFLLDLGIWLRVYGQNLDPAAPLSSAIKPFTPPVLGVGTVGQFKTIAYVGGGWVLAFGTSLCIIAAMIVHFRTIRQRNQSPPSDA